jgi:hypothetical protein
MFRATMCPSSGADDYVVLSPRDGVVPWLQEGCQNRLAGSVSIEEFVAQQHTHTHHTELSKFYISYFCSSVSDMRAKYSELNTCKHAKK